jgi:hypothetical protein
VAVPGGRPLQEVVDELRERFEQLELLPAESWLDSEGREARLQMREALTRRIGELLEEVRSRRGVE